MEDNKMEESGTAVVENYFTMGEGTGDFLLSPPNSDIQFLKQTSE